MYWGIPKRSIEYIIENYLDGDISKVDAIVIPDEVLKGAISANGLTPQIKSGLNIKFDKVPVGYFWFDRREKYLGLFRGSPLRHFIKFGRSVYDRLTESGAVKPLVKRFIFDPMCKKNGWDKTRILLCDHHTAHALASLYFVNDKQKRLLFTVDCWGDNKSSTIGIWDGSNYKPISSSHWECSLGNIYSEITGFLGMKPGEHEFKVMGMAPYAHHESVLRVKKILDKLYYMTEKGVFKQTVGFYDIPAYFIRHLSYERFDVIAGAVQLFTEEILVKWVSYWINKTGIHSITCGGGVFMNVKAAKRIYEMDEVNDIFITPSSGDESLALGALYHGNKQLDQGMTNIKDLYLGREFSNEYIKDYLETIKERYEFEFYSEDEMAVQAARLLADNKIVARCAGREEWGARALGNRSIMCNAKYYKNIDILNQYIKSRDFWMPFTPSILAEDMDEYIVNPKNMFAPYMCVSFDSTEKAREEIPAAIHPKDYTVRPQAVVKEWNPGYYKIIVEFKKLTGCGAVLNTSFNLHGEPNVGGPEDAIHTLDNSKLEYVILGSFLVRKKSD
jgi:carbamoyltransferase